MNTPKKILQFFWFCLVLLCQLSYGFDTDTKTQLENIEIQSMPDEKTGLIFTLKKRNPEGSLFNFLLLDHPDRLVIDFSNTTAESHIALSKNIQNNMLAKGIRLGHGPLGTDNLRIVVDLSDSIDYLFLNDSDAKNTTQKITVILTRKKIPAGQTTTEHGIQETEKRQDLERNLLHEPDDLQTMLQHNKPLMGHSKKIITQLKSDPYNNMQATAQSYVSLDHSTLKKVVVMIDPGHGGKDSGAIGPSHVQEKNVVLAIAKKLRNYLNESPGINAELTRTGDYFISLRQRLTIARHHHAEIFLAVHADAYVEPEARGASVFALSEHGATSEAARWLSYRENASELAGIPIKQKDKVLQSVLLDMSQSATIQYSLTLGRTLLNQLKSFTALHADQVEQAGFVVLKSPDIPSALVETGFVSNPSEEQALSSDTYQTIVASALASGIQKYFAQNPPPNSWFEMKYTPRL